MVINSEFSLMFKKATKSIRVKGKLKYVYAINCGYCEEWTNIVWKQLKKKKFIINGEEVQASRVTNTTACWIDCGYAHFWIFINGLHYDAETLIGVEDWRNLRLFQRIREKGKMTKCDHEVIFEDFETG